MMKQLELLSIILIVMFLHISVKAKTKNDTGLVLLERISFSENLDEFKSSVVQTSTNKKATSSLSPSNGSSLEFQDFLAIINSNHPDIVSAQINQRISSSKLLEAQGAFDPSFNSLTSFNRFNSSSAPGDAQEAFISNNSLDFLTGYGAKFGVGAKFAQGDIKTPFSPTGEAGEYFVKMQIPLLRGAIYNSQSVKEKSAKLNETIADFMLYRTKLSVLSSGSKAYWDWVSSKLILDAEINLLTLINNQVEFVQQQADLGNLPQIAVTEAKSEVQKRQGSVNKSLRSFQEASIKLSKFLWTELGKPHSIPSEDEVPESIATPVLPTIDELDDAKLSALSQRPEFKSLDFFRQIVDLERKLAKNEMLPQLNTFISSGVETGDLGIGPTLEAGVDLSLPLRVRSAKGRKEQAEYKIKLFNLEERKLIQNVFLEIEDAASARETSYQRYLAAQENFELTKALEDGEKERFELGDSTLFVVIRRQRATLEAKNELIKSLADYQFANSIFYLSQGDLE